MFVRAALLEASLSDLVRRLPHALWGLESRLLVLAHRAEQHRPPPEVESEAMPSLRLSRPPERHGWRLSGRP